MTTFELGSQTVKGGFVNEKDICAKFNHWKKDNKDNEVQMKFKEELL